MALGKGLKFEDLWRSKCVCVRVCVVQGFPNVTSVFRRFGYEPVVVLRRTWTPKVCRIIAFYRFWGHYFNYFWGSRYGFLACNVPVVSIVVPFWGYPIGPLLYIWLNQKKNYNGDYRFQCGSESQSSALIPEP